MNYIASYVSILLVAGALSGCNGSAKSNESLVDEASLEQTTMSPREKEVVATMLWVEDADPQADAALMLKNDKPELMAFAGRGLSYPGLTKNQVASIKNKVGYQVAEGSSDTIYGNSHRSLRKKLREYATVYNQIIFDAVK
ncbi:MAG: hypothetical protein AB8B86_16390 [Pseudomonadales bacterium]